MRCHTIWYVCTQHERCHSLVAYITEVVLLYHINYDKYCIHSIAVESVKNCYTVDSITTGMKETDIITDERENVVSTQPVSFRKYLYY